MDLHQEMSPQPRQSPRGDFKARSARRRTLKMQQIPIDPDENDFNELMNPVDYFNIYKRKMEELAHQRFDKEQDAVFYSYLDKLTNKEQFQKDGKVDGNKML